MDSLRSKLVSLLLSVTFTGLDKHTSLPYNLSFSIQYEFVMFYSEGPGLSLASILPSLVALLEGNLLALLTIIRIGFLGIEV